MIEGKQYLSLFDKLNADQIILCLIQCISRNLFNNHFFGDYTLHGIDIDYIYSRR